MMTNLTRAHDELFRRTADETFSSLDALADHCRQQKAESVERWERPQDVVIKSDLKWILEGQREYRLNDWAFSQICKLSGINKQTVNRLSARTAQAVLQETIPRSEKPVQFLTTEDQMRSVHGVTYTRLWNHDLISTVQEFATDFQTPQQAVTGGSGLYCGEQDLFCFMIDPAGWTEIDGEAFAPGFFVWNSEVGRRSLGMQSFWFQSVCQNHIVWDAVQVVEFKRKHTANVHEGLDGIRRSIEALVRQRTERQDAFVHVIRKAITMKLGDGADEVSKLLAREGIPTTLVKNALEIARQQGAFTIFSVVDALTRLTHEVRYAGDRATLDHKIGQLLALAV